MKISNLFLSYVVLICFVACTEDAVNEENCIVGFWLGVRSEERLTIIHNDTIGMEVSSGTISYHFDDDETGFGSHDLNPRISNPPFPNGSSLIQARKIISWKVIQRNNLEYFSMDYQVVSNFGLLDEIQNEELEIIERSCDSIHLKLTKSTPIPFSEGDSVIEHHEILLGKQYR